MSDFLRRGAATGHSHSASGDADRTVRHPQVGIHRGALRRRRLVPKCTDTVGAFSASGRCFLAEILAGFIRVASELLGDVGERLVYRAHMYARSDILCYKPASGDLAYPEKLQMMQVSD